MANEISPWSRRAKPSTILSVRSILSIAFARPITRPSFCTATSTLRPCTSTGTRELSARDAASRVNVSAIFVRLAWLAASCCSMRFSTSWPIFGSAGATPAAAAARVASSTIRGMSMTITSDPGGGGPRRRSRGDPSAPARPGPPRRGVDGGIGIGTLSVTTAGAGGGGTSGAGWNSTRSTSAAVSPSRGATLSRTVCGSGLNGRSGDAVPATKSRSMRRPTSAVTISMRRLTSVALSVASR